MRFLLTVFIIAIIAGLAEWFGPWWLATVMALTGGLLSGLNTGRAFLAGACGIGLLWLAVFLWRDIPNGHILSNRMALLMINTKSAPLYGMITVLIGFIAGGLSAWAGAQLRLAFRR